MGAAAVRALPSPSAFLSSRAVCVIQSARRSAARANAACSTCRSQVDTDQRALRELGEEQAALAEARAFCDSYSLFVKNTKAALGWAGRESCHDAQVCVGDTVKALEAAGEEWKVVGEQLVAYSIMLELALATGADPSLPELQCARLLSGISTRDSSFPPWFTSLPLPSSSILDSCAKIVGWIQPKLCSAEGAGFYAFLAVDDSGLGNNVVAVSLRDGDGRALPHVTPDDVAVTVEGGEVASVTVPRTGLLLITYDAPAVPTDTPLTLHCAVFGRSVITNCSIEASPVSRSLILGRLPPSRIAQFWRELTQSWMPCQTLSLLYRGSRDGMDSRCFHHWCDKQGPTLTLIRTTCGHVFGGYLSCSWFTPMGLPHHCSKAFLFTVECPGGRIERFPLRHGGSVSVHGSVSVGPSWGPVLTLGMRMGSEGVMCHWDGGDLFQDGGGQGAFTFTGASRFRVEDVEVYRVTQSTPWR